MNGEKPSAEAAVSRETEGNVAYRRNHTWRPAVAKVPLTGAIAQSGCKARVAVLGGRRIGFLLGVGLLGIAALSGW